MIRTLTFVNLMDRWFCDLPEYKDTLDIIDVEMVAGADLFIENLARGKKIVTLQASIEELEEYDGLLEETILDKGSVGDYLGTIYNEDGETIYTGYAWLCDVAIKVFGGFPNKIYFKVV